MTTTPPTCDDPLAERIVELAHGGLDAESSASLLRHVEICAACSAELDFVADLTATAESDVSHAAAARVVEGVEVEGTEPRRQARWLWTGLAAAAVLMLVLAVQDGGPLRGGAATGLAALADRSAPPWVEIDLRATDGASSKAAFASAMEPYVAGDYAGAVRTLDSFASAHPDHVLVHFYRGIAHTQNGDLEAADDDMRFVAERADGYLRDHATWRRASVALLAGRASEARALLAPLAAGEGEFAANARALARRLDDRAPSPPAEPVDSAGSAGGDGR